MAAPPLHETILVTLCGLSPAVITETVWALVRQRGIVPDRVVAVTTAVGQEKIAGLFEPGATGLSVWEDLRRALGVGAAGPGGPVPLRDITTAAENEAAADCMMETLRRFVGRRDVRLCVSLAGGYKTMSALMHTAVTLLGRPEDLLTHVLVPDAVLGRAFYFPEQARQILERPGSEPVIAAEVAVTLVDVPFLSLRRFLEDQQLQGGTFSRLRAELQGRLDAVAPLPWPEIRRLEAFASEPLFLLNDEPFLLPDREYLMLHLLVGRALKQQAPLSYSAFGAKAQPVWERWQAAHGLRPKQGGQAATFHEEGDVRKLKSALIRALRAGPPAAQRLASLLLPEERDQVGLLLPPSSLAISATPASPEVRLHAKLLRAPRKAPGSH
jgi:CRISPR-associated protein NE0113 (Cas_NE0113)